MAASRLPEHAPALVASHTIFRTDTAVSFTSAGIYVGLPAS